jgi:hypothetical protein
MRWVGPRIAHVPVERTHTRSVAQTAKVDDPLTVWGTPAGSSVTRTASRSRSAWRGRHSATQKETDHENEHPFYPTVRVEREFHAKHLDDVLRLDEVTRTFIWAAKTRTSSGDAEIVRGHLTLGEVSAIRTHGVPRLADVRCDIQM